MNFKGSRTEANLLAAFSGESQARNKYTYYASAARKEGYQQIADIFEKTADNENDHHKIEAIFKSFARALKDAIKIISDEVASSKGVL